MIKLDKDDYSNCPELMRKDQGPKYETLSVRATWYHGAPGNHRSRRRSEKPEKIRAPRCLWQTCHLQKETHDGSRCCSWRQRAPVAEGVWLQQSVTADMQYWIDSAILNIALRSSVILICSRCSGKTIKRKHIRDFLLCAQWSSIELNMFTSTSRMGKISFKKVPPSFKWEEHL